MAEEQGLIKQTPREELMQKLQGFKVGNFNAKEQGELQDIADRFTRHFCGLCWSFLGISKGQLKTLNDDELAELGEMLVHYARPWAILQQIFTYGVPVIGWIFGGIEHADGDIASWCYLSERRRLKKAYGKDYFPAEAVKKRL